MDLSNLFTRMITIFIYILVGFICAKVKVIDDDSVKKINKVLLCIGQPAIILSSVLNTQLNMSLGDVVWFFVLVFIMQILLVIFGFVFTPLYVKKREDWGIFQFMVAFGNTGFMGVPIIAALFGDDMVFLASIGMVPFFIFVYSLGIILLKGHSKGEKIDLRFLLSPAFISVFLAVILFFLKLPLPVPVLDAADGLSDMLVPLSMVVIGANLGMSELRELYADWRMFVLSLVKLVISPLLIYFICGLFVKNQIFLGVLVVSAAMPVAVLASVLSTEYGGKVRLGSRGVFITTLLSLVTIPLMMALLF